MQYNIREFVQLYNKIYNELYDCEDAVEGYALAVQLYDAIHTQYQDFIRDFNSCRNDFIASDREAASFVYTLAAYQNIHR